MVKTTIVRITLSSLKLLKGIIAPEKNESMTHYFDRVADIMVDMENDRYRGWRPYD